MKIIMIFILCFSLVGCGQSKSKQVKEAYFDKGIEYAKYKMDELYGEDKSKKEREEFIELCDWLLEAESKKVGFIYDKENSEIIQSNND